MACSSINHINFCVQNKDTLPHLPGNDSYLPLSELRSILAIYIPGYASPIIGGKKPVNIVKPVLVV